MIARWWLGLCCALALAAPAARAAPGVFVIGDHDRYELSQAFTYLEDPGATLTLDDILEPRRQQAFRAVPQRGHGANFGFTHSAIWLRVTLVSGPATAPEWLLELAYPPLDSVELFVPGTGVPWERFVAGDRRPFSARAVPHRNHVLPVRVPAASATTIYLRLASEGTVVAPVTL
jgi:hypothetical protein